MTLWVKGQIFLVCRFKTENFSQQWIKRLQNDIKAHHPFRFVCFITLKINVSFKNDVMKRDITFMNKSQKVVIHDVILSAETSKKTQNQNNTYLIVWMKFFKSHIKILVRISELQLKIFKNALKLTIKWLLII